MVLTAARPRRAVGIIRVSHVGGREGERFISPSEQRDRIVSLCQAHGLQLVEVHQELDTSGGLPIERRPGLRAALQAIEAGAADTVVSAFFDRLFRSLPVQADVVDRIERAGGSVLTGDVGAVRADTAGSWLSSTLLGAVAEYQRRMTRERTGEAKRRAIERGVSTSARVVPGYRRGEDRRLVVVEAEAEVMRAAFQLRADGASWRAVQTFLRGNGIQRSVGGVVQMLGSRMYLGEVSNGQYVNAAAHPPIIERSLWQRANEQGGVAPGRKNPDRLLSGLGVLKCASCGGGLAIAVSTHADGRRYTNYRCPGTNNRPCALRVAIAAPLVEQLVEAHVRQLLVDESRTARTSVELTDARQLLAQRSAALDRAVDVLADVGDIDSAKQKLAALRAQLDEAKARVFELERLAGVSVTINAAADWSTLSTDGRRALVKAVLRRVVINAGRGAERVVFEAATE
jgi:DNA invertase Pin-like site-specific DNA recombinase